MKSVIAWFAALKASGDGEVAWEIMLLMNIACQKESVASATKQMSISDANC